MNVPRGQTVSDYIAGRPVLLCYSAGKDSGAAALALRAAGVPFTAVFCDTGWEARETYAYLDEVSPSIAGKIVRVRQEVELPSDLDALARVYEARLGLDYSAMVRVILQKGLLPSRGRKWCTDWLKVRPMADYVASLDEELLVVTGVRAEESAKRAMLGLEEFSTTYDCDVWRPILDWTEQDVVEAHQEAGIRPCPLYLDHDIRRLGCWPCINTRKSELRVIAEIDPGRIDVLRDLEVWTTSQIAARAMAKRQEAMDYDVIGWFHGRADSALAQGYRAMPIDQAVEWSRTTRGGTQLGMFAPVRADGGCMRWGMCEAPELNRAPRA